MKKIDLLKTIQLILYIALTGTGILIILTDRELYHLIANDPHIRALCILLWVTFVLSFLFIFIDFSFLFPLKKAYRNLDIAVASDPLSGIANRYSCDSIIEKYLGKPLPGNVGCIMLDLTSIGKANQDWGHLKGNELIHDFSGILQSSSANLCFVGRNSGNKFLALFENCSTQKMDAFLSRVEAKVAAHNTDPALPPIQYQYGRAYQEGEQVQSITDLISLSNRRIYSGTFSEEG